MPSGKILVAQCGGPTAAINQFLVGAALEARHRGRELRGAHAGDQLNTHVHFHVCVVDGVFVALTDGQSGAASIKLHPAQIDDAAIAMVQTQVQNSVRKRLLGAFVARGHLESHDVKKASTSAPLSANTAAGFQSIPGCA